MPLRFDPGASTLNQGAVLKGFTPVFARMVALTGPRQSLHHTPEGVRRVTCPLRLFLG